MHSATRPSPAGRRPIPGVAALRRWVSPAQRPAGADRPGRVHDVRETVIGPDTRLVSAKAQALHDWWRAANGGRLPLRSAFDVTAHAALVPHLFLVRVQADGGFLIQLLGEEVIRIFGHNSTGRIVRAEDRDLYGHALDAYYAAIVRDRCSRSCAGTLAHVDREFIRFEAIDCPLSDDGVTVSAILGAVEMVG